MGKKISVAVLYYAGTHDDDEDTLGCVKGIEESLTRTHHPAQKVLVTPENWKKAIQTPADVVFNFVEDDTWNLYKKVGLALERLGRAQVGHDEQGFRYAIQKVLIKKQLTKLHIPTPKFIVFTKKSKTLSAGSLTYPLIIKPSQQHAGIGIAQASVVTNDRELKHRVQYLLDTYAGDVIAEEYIEGKEIHVSVMGNGKPLTVFPFCEIGFGGKFKKNWNVYTYKAKWDKKSWEYWDARTEAPANISTDLHKKIETEVVKAYRAFACRDIARFDVRVNKEDKPFIVDVNMNPSLNFYDEQDATLASVYALGWTYDQFIETLIDSTYRRVYAAKR